MHVGGREADIFELFAQPRGPQSNLLIRAEHNRNLRYELDYLIPTLAQAPVLGTMSVALKLNPKRPARTAKLTVKAMAITLEVTRHHPKPHTLEPVTLNAILVEAPIPPADGRQLIRWLLLTTLPIDTPEQLLQAVQWHRYRWLIECFHFTLKRGCGLEDLQLETAFRLRQAQATYAIVAWRLMWLTYRARLTPDEPCDSANAIQVGIRELVKHSNRGMALIHLGKPTPNHPNQERTEIQRHKVCHGLDENSHGQNLSRGGSRSPSPETPHPQPLSLEERGSGYLLHSPSPLGRGI